MSRLLVVGASILQLPAILKAKEMGHYVAVADYDPEAVGIPYADEYYNASTIDIDAITDIARVFKQRLIAIVNRLSRLENRTVGDGRRTGNRLCTGRPLHQRRGGYPGAAG